MAHIAIIPTLDSLGARHQTKASYFGLTISVGVRDQATDATTPVVALVRPWHWSVDAVKLLVDDGQGFAPWPGASVRLLDVHASPKPAADPDYVRLVREMEARWQAYRSDPSRFVWGSALAEEEVTEETPVNSGAKPWPVFLANASSQPYPYAQWLNLSIHLRVDWGATVPPDSARVVAAPEVTMASGTTDPAFTFALPNPSSAIAPAPGTGEVTWNYEGPAGAPAAVAHCGSTPLAPQSFGAIDGGELWVKLSGAQGVFGTEWRSEVQRAAPEVFDLAQRVLDAYRELVADPSPSAEPRARSWMAPVRQMVVASLADRVSPGHRPGPGDTTTPLQWWALALPQFAQIFAQLAQRLATAPSITLEEWKDVLRTALRVPGEQQQEFVALRASTDMRPPVPQEPAEVLGELQRLVAALRQPATLVRVLLLRWRRIGVAFPANFEAQVTSVGSAPESGATMLRLLSMTAAAPMWDRWMESLRLNLASPQQRRQLAADLPGVVRRALFDRFGGTPPGDLTVSSIPSVATSAPRAGAVATELSAWLDREANTWAVREATRLIPTETTTRPAAQPTTPPATPGPGPAATPRKVAERVPHPLAIEVGLVQPFVGGGSPQGDREDALRHFSGFGVLIRRADRQNWRCLNLAAAGDILAGTDSSGDVSSRLRIERWGKRPLVAPLRIGYQDGVSEATVSYDNRPLAALSPDALLGDHGLRDPDGFTGDKPVLRYVYIPPDQFPANGLLRDWSKLDGLVFGKRYKIAMFVAANSGALPRELAATPDTLARLHPDPATLPEPPLSAVREVWYPRRVGVGQPRLARGATTSDSRSIATHPIPAEVLPRVRELFGRSVEDSGPEGSFLLLAPPNAASTYPTSFDFEVRRPSTDLQTWLRWQLDGTLNEAQLVAVVKEYYSRMSRNHADPQNPQPLLLDDPCVAMLVAHLLEYDADNDQWTTVKRVTGSGAPVGWDPGVDETDGIAPAGLPPAARTNGRRLSVRVQATTGSAARLEIEQGRLVARVVEGRIYRLIVANAVDGDDRFDPEYAVGQPDEEIKQVFAGVSVMSPWTLWIEVATPRWTAKPAPTGTTPAQARRAMLDQVYDELHASFSGGTPDVDGRIRDEGSLRLSAALDLNKFPFVHRCELQHQRWVWQGRPPALPALRRLARERWQEGFVNVKAAAEWEATEFGERAESNMVVHLMDTGVTGNAPAVAVSAPRPPAPVVPATRLTRRATHRTWSYTLDFTGDRGASYHRFAMYVYHRYEALFPGLSKQEIGPQYAATAIDNHRWRWRSYLVPCRPADGPIRPVVRVILPLTARADDTSPPERSPGLLVVTKGAAFENGGLAEQFHTQGVLTGRGADLLYEIAPDPRDTGAADPVKPDDARDPMAYVDACGPIGHSFDSEPGLRRMVTASYLIPPPSLGRDLTGYFVKLRFGRALDPQLTVPTVGKGEARGEVTEWSEGHWTQLLADSRIVSTAVPVSRLELTRGGNAFVTRDRTTGQAVSPLSPADPRPVHALLAVTRRIADAANDASEAWVGVFREAGPGEWRWLGDTVDGKTVQLTLGEGLYNARVLYLVRGDRSTVPDFSTLTESQLWDRLFESAEQHANGADEPRRLGAAVRERLQIVSISQPITMKDLLTSPPPAAPPKPPRPARAGR